MWRRSEPIHTSYCQAQPKPRPKLGAELVLISNNPATHPPIHPEKYEGARIQIRPESKICLGQWVSLKDILKLNPNINQGRFSPI